jgi:hypothetical protein
MNCSQKIQLYQTDKQNEEPIRNESTLYSKLGFMEILPMIPLYIMGGFIGKTRPISMLIEKDDVLTVCKMC